MGQSVSNVIANVLNLRVPATLNFGHCLIVKNLGTTILIGQPTKVDHNIITNPRLNQIQFHDIHNVPHTIKYPLSPPKEYFESHVCRYDQTKILYPGDELEYQLPQKFSSVKRVVFSPRSELQQQGFQPTHYSLQPNLKMKILNETENILILPKHSHFADVRPVLSHESAMISKLYSIDESEISAFEPRKHTIEKGNFVQDIKLDPDEKLNESWKQKFMMLCEDYSDIIQYNPGTYNGRYGFVKNTIEFTSIPPPNNRCYVPKYSKEMLDTLADKMDELLELGILRRPEEIGVTPVFTSPSMLVPKPDKNDFRFVTDFSQLNNYICKCPALSPGIEETK